MHKILSITLFLLFLGNISVGQLKQLEVLEIENPQIQVVQANNNYPDNAMVIVYSNVRNLTFRSSMGGINQQRYNAQSNRYEILINPVRQILLVSHPEYLETRVSTINPQPKEVFYFQISGESNRFGNGPMTRNQKKILTLESEISTLISSQNFRAAEPLLIERNLRDEIEDAIMDGDFTKITELKKQLLDRESTDSASQVLTLRDDPMEIEGTPLIPLEIENEEKASAPEFIFYLSEKEKLDYAYKVDQMERHRNLAGLFFTLMPISLMAGAAIASEDDDKSVNRGIAVASIGFGLFGLAGLIQTSKSIEIQNDIDRFKKRIESENRPITVLPSMINSPMGSNFGLGLRWRF
ncbi:MAG: hypothetical protein JJU02_12945 [Cryomorphaceae bacterium]|nr:hypothetical protein [Cryomorphaceae bacterium]